MRHRTHLLPALLGAAVLAAAQSASAQPASAWKTFEPPSKFFTVQFPGVPAHETSPVDLGFDKETAHRYWVQVPGLAGGLFEVTHMKMPPHDGNLPHAIILDTTVDVVLSPLKQRGGREVSRAELKLNGCAGREFVAADAGGTTLHARVYLAGEQIFSVSHVGPPASAATQQAARRFHDSFALAAPCVPEPAPTTPPPAKKLGAISGPRDAATGWFLISPPASGFSALMPGAPEGEEERAQEKPYPLVMRGYAAEDGDSVYIAVECGDFPEGVGRVENFEEIKTRLAYRALLSEAEGLRATVVPEGDVRISGYDGKQYRLTAEGASGRAVIVSTPRKFYMFAAFTLGRTPPAGKFDRFFSSLKLTRP